MANILQLVQHLQVGGLEKMVFALSQKSQYADQTAIVALEGKKLDAIENWPELQNVERLACLNKAPKVSFTVVRKLLKLVDKWQIDVIHSHHIGPMFYAALVQKFRPKVKHVSTVHDAWYLQNTKARWMTKMICRLSSVTLVADAQAVAKEWHKQLATPADHVVLNGVDCQTFNPISKSTARKRLNLPMDKVLVGCAARLEAGKGHDALIQSLLKLPEKQHLVFAGAGSQMNALKQLASRLGVANRIHWLGCTQQMTAFYSAIDVFCLFSQREGLPLTILEAMSCNTPVVASDVGGVREVVSEQTGIVLPLSQIAKLPNSLIAAMSLKKGTHVRQYALKNRDLSCMAGSYDKIYQSVAL